MIPNQADIKIVQKGRILVAVPLIMGTVFLVVLLILLGQSRQEANTEARYKAVVAYATDISKLYYEGASAIATFGFSKSEIFLLRYRQIKLETETIYRNIKDLLGANKTQLQALQRLHEQELEAFKFLDMFEQAAEQEDLRSFFAVSELKSHFVFVTRRFTDGLTNFVTMIRSAVPPRDTHGWQNLIDLYILIGVGLNFGLSFALAALFSQGITGRLQNLLANSLRLAKKEELLPPLAGTDEIATVDHVFHDMATALAEAARRERAVIDHAMDVICSLSPDGLFLDVSPAASNVWGYDPHELVGKSLAGILARDQTDPIAAIQHSMVTQQDKGRFENTVRRPDGTYVHMLWSVQWSAHLSAFFCVAHDITERKKAEDLLKESESRTRLIIESMPVVLLILNGSGSIELSNHCAQTVFGYHGQDIAGQHISQLIAADSNENPDHASIKWLEQKFLGRVSNLIGLAKNGRTVPLDASLTEFQHHGERKLLFAALDVSDRFEIERLKRDFVAMVSHDLRTPLSSVQTTLNLLSAGAVGLLSKQAQELVERSERELLRLMRMITELLDVERLESGKLALDLKPVLMDEVLSRSVQAVAPLAEAKTINICVDHGQCEILADQERLIQVVVNLLSNAIKFSPAQSTISLSAVEIPTGIEVRIADAGRGIPSDQKGAIFERFRQVDKLDRVEQGGFGLGLAICKAIIEAHHGQIGVESEVGKGSTFWFQLPGID